MSMAYNKILIRFVWGLSFLLPCTHESSSWDDTLLDLRQMHLHHHAFFSSVPVPHLRHAVSRSADLQKDLALYIALGGSNHQLCFLEIPGSTSCEICLVLLSLSVRQVGTFICV